MLLTLACFTGCLCFANGPLFAMQKTPGEKLDHAIDTTKEKAKDAKKAAEEKADEAKEVVEAKSNEAKKKCDEARKEIADKIRPS